MEKRQFMPAMFTPADLEMMADLRRQMDPAEIANRGKMFPDGAPAHSARGPHPLEQQGVIARL
jgi:glycolate oxidase